MALTEPLTHGQQMLLQRLMAAHVLSEADATTIFGELNAAVGTGYRSIEECFRSINEQLIAGFGLEIATVSMDGTKYHALVNPHADDDVAKASFANVLPPAEREYMLKILETLVQDEEGTTTRVNLINLRNKLDPKFRITVEDAENTLDKMVAEYWLGIHEEKENRRTSLNKTEYIIGPRSYLELRHLLRDIGLHDLPQCFYHRKV
jgi:hypothetical protein